MCANLLATQKRHLSIMECSMLECSGIFQAVHVLGSSGLHMQGPSLRPECILFSSP